MCLPFVRDARGTSRIVSSTLKRRRHQLESVMCPLPLRPLSLPRLVADGQLLWSSAFQPVQRRRISVSAEALQQALAILNEQGASSVAEALMQL